MMTTRWFDREFDFSFGMERYDGLYQRLQNAAHLYQRMAAPVPEIVKTPPIFGVTAEEVQERSVKSN